MSDRWTDRLSEYLDGDLAAPERLEMEGHLGACAECATVLAELRAVMESARALPAVPPAEDLWPAIAARLGATDASSMGAPVTAKRAATRRGLLDWLGRGVTFTLPQAAAAAAVLVAIAGFTVWLALGRGAAPALRGTTASRDLASRASADSAAGPAVMPAGGPAAAASAGFDRRYDATIAELQRVLAEERGHLDPRTVQVLEKNLAIIDQAVAEARRAVEADSSNFYLRTHLASVMKRKADLLRTAALLAAAQGHEG